MSHTESCTQAAGRYMGLTSDEAFTLYCNVRRHLRPGWHDEQLAEIYQRDAARLKRLRIGQRFRASDLRHKWKVRGVGNILNRAVRFGIVAYDSMIDGERVYRRVK